MVVRWCVVGVNTGFMSGSPAFVCGGRGCPGFAFALACRCFFCAGGTSVGGFIRLTCLDPKLRIMLDRICCLLFMFGRLLLCLLLFIIDGRLVVWRVGIARAGGVAVVVVVCFVSSVEIGLRTVPLSVACRLIFFAATKFGSKTNRIEGVS